MQQIISPINPNDTGNEVSNLQEALLFLLDKNIFKTFNEPESITEEELKKLREMLEVEKANSAFGEGTRQLVFAFQLQQGLGESFKGAVEQTTADKFNELLKGLGVIEEPAKSPVETRLEFFKFNFGTDNRQQEAFDKIYKEKAGDWAAVSKNLNPKIGFTDDVIKNLEFTHQVADWTKNNPVLIKTFQEDSTTNSLSDIAAKYDRKSFTGLVGNTTVLKDGETAKNVADKLYDNLFHLAPVGMLKNIIEQHADTLFADTDISGGITTFLSNLKPDFNIKTTSVYEALKNKNVLEGVDPKFRAEVITGIKSLQRVTAISPSPEVVPVLIKANLTSALKVSNMPEDQFVKAFASRLGDNGEAVARKVHARAVNAQIRNEHALISLKEAKDGTGIYMTDKAIGNKKTQSDGETGGDKKDGSDKKEGGVKNEGSDQLVRALEENNLSWDSLFADAGFCECGECTSVYSASAYFVELLQYLRNNNLDPDAKDTTPVTIALNPDATDISKTPLQKLFNRRPDLGCLQLTCQNTNTILPYVDLVNEVMESYVVFNKSEPFHTTKPFNVTEDETSGELLSQPQHTQYKAYSILQKKVYPFTLPYHQPIDAARTYLKYLDTSRYELIDTFRSPHNNEFVLEPLVGYGQKIRLAKTVNEKFLDRFYEEYLARAADAEYLGLTQEEYIILTGEAFVSKKYWDYQSFEDHLNQEHSQDEYLDKIESRPVHQYYGYASRAAMLSVDENYPIGITFVKDQFLKRTGVQYIELVEMLKTQSLNLNIPKELSLIIMERIKVNYKVLQSLVRRDGPDTNKYDDLIEAIVIITDPGLLAKDPCNSEELSHPLKKEDLKEWVNNSFEKVGKIIVLDDTPHFTAAFWDHRRFTEKSNSESPKKETCDLDNIRLMHLDGSALTVNEYDHIHRFIRLWRKLGWSIPETDNAIAAFGREANAYRISSQMLHQLAAVKKVHEQTGLELIKLLSFWTNISTIGEKSLYQRLFLTHNLLRVDPVFNADERGRYLAAPNKPIVEHIPVLMAALNFSAGDIEAIIAYNTAMTQKLTIENVSALYRFRLLSKILGLRIPDFISVLALLGDPFKNAATTLLFLENWGRMEDSGFNYPQLNYIIRNQDDPKKPVAFSQKALLQFSKTLYDGLNAIEETHHDLIGNEEEIKLHATAELVKQKAALLYDQATAEKILAFLGGDIVYSAVCPKNIKDGMRPVPSGDYENLQLDNYPLISRKIKYDGIKGSLQIKGILTNFEREGSSDFFNDDIADLTSLVNKLTGSDPLSRYLWSKFSATRDTLRTMSNATPQYQQEMGVASELNTLVTSGVLIYDAVLFGVTLSKNTITLSATNPVGHSLAVLNRLLLEDAYPEIVKNARPGFLRADFRDFPGMSNKLFSNNRDHVALYLFPMFSPSQQVRLQFAVPDAALQQKQLEDIVEVLNNLIKGPSIAGNLVSATFSLATRELIAKNPAGVDERKRLNRMLLEDAYPQEIVKNKRTGFIKVLENLMPYFSLKITLEDIENQQEKLFGEIFNRAFDAVKTDILKGDMNDQPIDPVTKIDNNTAPLKRARFLEIFLPFLRKELIHRFIVSTVSNQAALSNDVAGLLITKILTTGNPPVSIDSLFENVKEIVDPGINGWDGNFVPPIDEQYTFIVKGGAAAPGLILDGHAVNFTRQPGLADEWRSNTQTLKAGKSYIFPIVGANLESVSWKTAASTTIGYVSLWSGWNGYFITSKKAEYTSAEYTFIVEGCTVMPTLSLNGNPVNFTRQSNPADEWWSDMQLLEEGKSYKLSWAAVNPKSVSWESNLSPARQPVLSSSGWEGYLIPPSEGSYTLIVKGNSAPAVSIDDETIVFASPATSPGEYWSTDHRLQAGRFYKLKIAGLGPESLYWKTATSAIVPFPPGSGLSGYAEDYATKAYAYLQKAALLINGFKLSADEILYFQNLDFNTFTFAHFLRLESYTRLRNSLPAAAEINILEFFNWAQSTAASPQNLSEKIEAFSGWKKESIQQLIADNHFNLLNPAVFYNETYLLKIQKALNVSDKIGMGINLLFDWANPDSDFENCLTIAGSIQSAIRAKYNQEDWEEVVKPLSDKLRENQKNALIAYLLVQPDVIEWGVKDADGLFEFFLIDVQMDACMETSRIVQAISSIQLFVQRCFLGLEEMHSDIKQDLLSRERWNWMQRYRLWEANRKVFLYPENWIESNLRDDKSPFFKELESELLQKDINTQNVEDALKTYLYKVDEVSNMEVVGLYIEEGKKLHVFSRTRNAPYFFFYRYLDLTTSYWYPWEKMQLDIPGYDVEDETEIIQLTSNPASFKSNPNYKKLIGNGSYLTPIVWNNRLLIFFPQFIRKTKSNDDFGNAKSAADMSKDSTGSNKPIEYWEIKMAWSEYRNGKWTQKQLSKDSVYDIPVLNGFWKNFNEFSRATIKKDEAHKEFVDRQNIYNEEKLLLERKYLKIYNPPIHIDYYKSVSINPTFSPYQVTLTAIHHLAGPNKDVVETLIEPKDDNNTTFFEAQKNFAAAKLQKDNADLESRVANDNYYHSVAPVPIADISKYEFVPVILNADFLISIEVYHNQQERGAFEFDGSNIMAKLPNNGRHNSIAVDHFHYHSSTIKSLQKSNTADDYVFSDTVNSNTFQHFTISSSTAINFYHTDAHKLLGLINSQHLDTFFRFPLEGIGHNTDKDDVYGGYYDDQNIQIYHELKRPYSIYNWELFFHTPMMLADALSKSQQFEEAMKWYHYVFNPIAEQTQADPLWQFSPFDSIDAKHILDHIFNKLQPNAPDRDINEWRNNPFKPHLVARDRPVAYMKWVVMKYIDNLVAWGDYLFRQDSIESINQATQLYVLAGHILGPRPQMIPKRGKTKPQTYLSLLDKWDAFSNAMIELELALPYSSQPGWPGGRSGSEVGFANVFGSVSSSYFCIPDNPKLIGYWDTIADRLFKIRHCENIEGIFRKLPLFEPPIDPAMLVNAAAQGLSIASVLNDLNSTMPNYRFYYLLQKALELCGELKSMGSTILSAIEKKDNEAVSRIRAKHESGMHNLVMEIKKQQLEEAGKALESLQQNRKSPEHRMKYYLQLIGENADKVPGSDADFSEINNAIEVPVNESGLKLIKYEKEEMDKSDEARSMQIEIGQKELLASILHLIPSVRAATEPIGLGASVEFGGPMLGGAIQAWAKALQNDANGKTYMATNAAKKGGFLRSLQERVMQANAAGYEIKQIDKQILSQQIRIQIAKQEIANQQKQIDNAQEIEDFLTNKYTNTELYSWMKDSLSALYHQVYSVAFDLAKKAEKTYRFERGLSSSSFINAGYWDAGRNGLLAGENLYVGLKQLEAAYQENRGYDYEITKHISLRQLDPFALLQLKRASPASSCEFDLPEILFDMDFPGHYKRRIKSVSVSIPCIAGPYTSVNATLQLLNNKFRNSSIAANYPEKTDETDARFVTYNIPVAAIATSSAQNDSGMFELNFKDERYLPFEGAGVISRWKLELPPIKQFDYNTISDVILHVRYIASEGGDNLKISATTSVKNFVAAAADLSEREGFFILIDLKHDMPHEWNQLIKNLPAVILIDKYRLPYLAQLPGAVIDKVTFIIKSLSNPASITIDTDGTGHNPQIDTIPLSRISGWKNMWKGENDEIVLGSTFKLSTPLVADEDLMMVVKYHF